MRVRAQTKLISLLEAFGCLPREPCQLDCELDEQIGRQLIRERLDALDGE